MAFSVPLSFSKVTRIKRKFSTPYKQLVKSRKQDILSSKQSIGYPRNGNRKNSQRDSFDTDINLNHSPRETVGYVYESTKLSTFRLSQIDSIDSSKTLFEGIYRMLSFTFYLCYDIAQSNSAKNIGNTKLQSRNVDIYFVCYRSKASRVHIFNTMNTRKGLLRQSGIKLVASQENRCFFCIVMNSDRSINWH